MRYLLIALWFVVTACTPSTSREIRVGRSHVLYHDATRPSWQEKGFRPLATTVWYHARHDAEEKPWEIDIFQFGVNALNATPFDGEKKRPLILVSHGTGGSAAQLSWLAEELVQKGFIVAAVNHYGNTAAEEVRLPEGFVLWWERAEDLSRVLDALLADPHYAPMIDEQRIGVAGFSLGGYTALASVGAITERKRWEEICAKRINESGCTPPPESTFSMDELVTASTLSPSAATSVGRSSHTFRDPRIRAAFVIAPAITHSFTDESLRAISVPVKVISGDSDAQASSTAFLNRIAHLVPQAQFETLKDVAHYTFLAPCSWRGKQFVPELCADPNHTDRTQIHQQVAHKAVQFFQQHLE